VPLDWAATQNNLGAALATLGERESGTAYLTEAMAAYRAALEERTRDRVPLDWAATQNKPRYRAGVAWQAGAPHPASACHPKRRGLISVSGMPSCCPISNRSSIWTGELEPAIGLKAWNAWSVAMARAAGFRNIKSEWWATSSRIRARLRPESSSSGLTEAWSEQQDANGADDKAN
jgi:hypothetical protein